jgi:hypothetical protein
VVLLVVPRLLSRADERFEREPAIADEGSLHP